MAPFDDWSPYACMALITTGVGGNKVVRGVIAPLPNVEDLLLKREPMVPCIDEQFRGSVIPLIIIPATFLFTHAVTLSGRLEDVELDMKNIESSFDAREVVDLPITMTELRNLNKRVIVMEQRLIFQIHLGTSILGFLEHFDHQTDKSEFKQLQERVEFCKRASHSVDYRLRGLTRRIDNLFSTASELLVP
jgi:hypothetical protein